MVSVLSLPDGYFLCIACIVIGFVAIIRATFLTYTIRVAIFAGSATGRTLAAAAVVAALFARAVGHAAE